MAFYGSDVNSLATDAIEACKTHAHNLNKYELEMLYNVAFTISTVLYHFIFLLYLSFRVLRQNYLKLLTFLIIYKAVQV